MSDIMFVEGAESSEDDEVDSLDHRMTNEAIAASSTGGLSKSGMGRAAALGMDVGSVEKSNPEFSDKSGGDSRHRPSIDLKKKITSLMNKAKDAKAFLFSKHLIGRPEPARRNNESSPSRELKLNAPQHFLRQPQGDDLFSLDALASQRSSGISLVDKLGMAPAISHHSKHTSKLSQGVMGRKNDLSQKREPREKGKKEGPQLDQRTGANNSKGPGRPS